VADDDELKITAEPHWPIPSRERLRMANPGHRLRSQFRRHHRGLREIRLTVFSMTTRDGTEHGGEIQKFTLDTGEGEVPEVEYTELAQLTWLRGERYVRSHKAKTQFRVLFIKRDAKGARDQKECRFMIKPTQVLEDDLEADDDGDGTDDDEEEYEEEEDGEYEDDDGDDEDVEDNEYEDDDEDDDDSPSALVPLKERETKDGMQLVPQQINPAFITAVQRDTLKLAHRAYTSPMKENRILVRQMRRETGKMVDKVQNMAEMLLTQQMEMAARSEARQDKIIEHLYDRLEVMEGTVTRLTELSVKDRENLKELAREGWRAFHDAMRMKEEVVNDRVAWARWVMEDNERREPPPPPPASTGGGFMDLITKAQESPMVVAMASIALRKMGNDREADLLEKIAVNMSGADEEEDAADKDPVDVDATERPNGHARHARQAGPLGVRIRAFRDSVGDERLEKLKSIMPKEAWSSFELACRAPDDKIVVQALTAMATPLDDMGIKMKIAGVLTPDQITELLSIVDAVKQSGARREPPRRPPPRPDPQP